MKHLLSSIVTISLFVWCTQISAQWHIAPQNATETMHEVAFPAADAAYILADFGRIYKSTNGGLQWNNIYDFGPFTNLSNILFVNADTGFVAVYSDVYRSIDGGLSWNPVGSNIPVTNGYPLDRVKKGGERLFASYASNDTAYLIRSDDYGTSWNTAMFHTEPGAKPFLFTFIDEQFGYIINPNELEQVLHTTDAGASRDTIFITNGPLTLQAQWDFKDAQFGYFYGSWGSESSPTRTWNTGSFYFPIDLDGFGVLPVLDLDWNAGKLYASSLYGKIFYSESHGTMWIEQSTPVTDPVVSIAFLDANRGLAITGYNVLYTTNGGITGVPEGNPQKIILIFPNPASGHFVIGGLEKQTIQSLMLYDGKGSLVRALNIADDQHSVNDLDSGIYFLEIRTEAGISSEKLVVK